MRGGVKLEVTRKVTRLEQPHEDFLFHVCIVLRVNAHSNCSQDSASSAEGMNALLKRAEFEKHNKHDEPKAVLNLRIWHLLSSRYVFPL